MSNMGNKVSRLSAGTQARQGHRTGAPKKGLCSFEVSQMQPVVAKDVIATVSITKLNKMNKLSLMAHASSIGLDVNEKMTVKTIKQLIKGK